MKVDMKSSKAVILAMVVFAMLAAAFWILLLSPKREQAEELSTKVSKVEVDLAQHRSEAEAGALAREEFPVAYQQVVVLGKAVPADDDTASLLVQVNRIADNADVKFNSLELKPSGEAAPAEAPAPPSEVTGTTPASSLPSPTEVAASTLPLGASIGPAGLAVMPYTLTFTGDFFQMADFIKGLDSLVKTENQQVNVTGRLITINGFSLVPEATVGFPELEATFSVTTFVTPPAAETTISETPAPSGMTPAATTTGGSP